MSKDKLVLSNKTFTGDTLLDGRCFISNSIVGDELTIDTLTATVYSTEDLTMIPHGTPVKYYHGTVLIGKFYLDEAERTGKHKYALSCVSGIGLLEDAGDHYGGIYNGETVSEVLADIIGTIVPYTVTTGVGVVRLYGWLPIESRRAALQQVLFAVGAAIKKSTAGEIAITLLTLGNPTEISEDRLYANGSVKYRAAVSRATVLEHSFLQTQEDEEVTLYDDSVSAAALVSPKGQAFSGALVTFDAPMYGLTVTGGSILESGCNYAVLSSGSGVILKGKKYTHITREVHADVEGSTGEAKEAKVEDATLVNFVNSEAVAQREAKFYSLSRILKMRMVMGTERPGDAVHLLDPFDQETTALMMSQDITMSNTLAAQAELLAGYIPQNSGVYEHVAVITANGTFTIPSGVTKIRVVLISGGDGGCAGGDGEAGENGQSCSVSPNSSSYTATGDGGEGGAGGSRGVGGAGGRIGVFTLDVPAGVSSAAIQIGAGGTGSTQANQAGAPGNPTKLTLGGQVYSSATGESSPSGFSDLLSGQNFGQQGAAGQAGAPGGAGVVGKTANANDNFATGETTAIGESGGSIPPKSGGAGGTGSYSTGGRIVVSYTYAKGMGYSKKKKFSAGATISQYTSYTFNSTTGVFTLKNMRNHTVPNGSFTWYETTNAGKTLCEYTLGSTPDYGATTYSADMREYNAQAQYGVAYGKGLGGGGGGGAAVSNNGGAASANTGGAGANGTKPATPTTPGTGGTGGNGGGGGGGGGGSLLLTQSTIQTTYTCPGGTGGVGGLGGPGGDGAPGVAIIYY